MMICPVCKDGFSNLRMHLTSSKDELHRIYVVQEKKRLEDFVNSHFSGVLSIRKVLQQVRVKDFAVRCTKAMIKNMWIETFGEVEYEKRDVRIDVNIELRRIKLNIDEINVDLEIEIEYYRRKMYKIVRQRDEYCCQECGDRSKRKFDVHHIIPKRLYSRYDFTQHDPGNLVVLCKECHSIIGQELDNLYLDIFERLIYFMFPTTYKYIINKLKSLKKSIFKRKVGAPKQYVITKDQLLKYIRNNIVNLHEVSRHHNNMPTRYIRRACRLYNLAFVRDNELIKTKICPICNWSTANLFSDHIIENKDEAKHRQFLNELERLYVDEGLVCSEIVKRYKHLNISISVLKNILKRTGIFYKDKGVNDVRSSL